MIARLPPPRRPIATGGVLAAVLLGGCQVGPDFAPPAPPEAAGYTSARAAPHLTVGGGEPSQLLVTGEAIPEEWWRLFRSRSLDSVVRQAIAGSPTIEAAEARLAEAQQAVLVARGALYPQLDASALAERQKGPPFALGLLRPRPLPVYNLFSGGPMVSFAPDVFGLTARRVERQSALAENQAYQLAAAQLAVTGNAVAQALTIASVRSQINAVEAIVADDAKNVALVRQKYVAGKIDRTDLLLAEAQLENDRASLPPLRQQKAVAEDALAILVGKSPAEWTAPAFTLAEFALPPDLPLSLPSELVHRRPDILAAEAELHASSAAIGVATAQLYPIFTISAALDPTTLALSRGSTLAWSALASVTAPIFHGGALEAQKQEAIDAFHASVAAYRQTVLQGLGQAADVLRALGHDAELVKAERRALDSAKSALALERVRHAEGKVDALRLLDAERSYQQARVGHARARGQRYLDSAQLLVALGGGGWWKDGSPCGDCGGRLSLDGRSAPPASRFSSEEGRWPLEP